jgi:hypothetical protein
MRCDALKVKVRDAIFGSYNLPISHEDGDAASVDDRDREVRRVKDGVGLREGDLNLNADVLALEIGVRKALLIEEKDAGVVEFFFSSEVFWLFHVSLKLKADRKTDRAVG